MIALDRMPLADLASPDALVQGVLRQLPDIPIPVPIHEIALALDITNIEALTTRGFEGGLVTNRAKSTGVILVNQGSHQRRQRFTVGHELGHFLSPWHEPMNTEGFRCTSRDFTTTDTGSRDKAKKMEAEANRFAAGILMPIAQFRNDVRSRGGPELEQIVTLSDRYDVSKEALGRRYVEVCDDCCALIISRDERFLYSYRHREFPFIQLRSNDPLPRESLKRTCEALESEVTEWTEVAPDTWVTGAKNVTALYEQTLVQQNGYRMILLQAELKEEEEADEEDNLRESWTPRFPR